MIVAFKTGSTPVRFAVVLFLSLVCPALLAATDSADCTVDKKALMALDEQQFDQDMANGGGGWRALERKPGCELAAADIINEYRTFHHSESSLSYWHEGQLRALHGDYRDAIPLLEKSKKRPAEDSAGWNPYVDATVAFLKKDRIALDDARARLAATKPEAGMVVQDGFVEAHMSDGIIRKMRWPMNLDVVDGLRKCFDQSYVDAYGTDKCRK